MLIYNPYGFWTLFKRETKRYLKVYEQTVIGPLLSNMLFLAVFGAIFRNREIGIEGASYLEFIVPGLCTMGAVMNAFQNPSSSLIQQKYQNIIQDINTFPLTIFEKTMAFIVSGAFRGLLVGILTYVATIYFVGYQIENPALFFTWLFVVAAIFSSLGMMMGLYFESFDRLGFFLNIILTPLVYLGGVFFEISRLPGILAEIAMFNPLFPLVDTVRFFYLGIHEGNLWFNLVYSLDLFIVLIIICYSMVKRGIGLKD